MFTGLITDIGAIEASEEKGGRRLRIGCHYDMASVAMGASIACSGVCLTVVDKGPNWFAVDISGETLGRTADKMWEVGEPLNLERALKVGDELGGHIVTGHVDGVGRIEAVVDEAGGRRMAISVPESLAAMVAEKGSIAVDGVSLTINSVEDAEGGTLFTVNIIPHTLRHTTLGELEAGDPVNLEIDLIARYLARMQDLRASL